MLMGVDIGTTSSKGVLISEGGKTIASFEMEHRVERPAPGFAEMDAQSVWYGDFCMIARELLSRAGAAPHSVEAVGVSGMYPVLVPVDTQGRALHKGILYGIDSRAVQEIEELRCLLGEEYSIELTGNGITTQSIAPKIMWLKKNEPKIFCKTACFLFATSYLVAQLTGKFVLDHGSASLGGLPYDARRSCWDERACAAAGIRTDQLPELRWGDEITGQITQAAAVQCGLLPGTPVVTGTGDHIAEVLGTGGLVPGRGTVSYGTTFGFDVCCDRLVSSPGLQNCRTCLPDSFLIGGGMATGAVVSSWFRDQFAEELVKAQQAGGRNAYEVLADWAATVPPGSEGLVALPYLNGERCPFFDPQAKAVMFGLTARHTAAHVYRALLEGVSMGVRQVIETVASAGLSLSSVTAVGGAARNIPWVQMISDACGIHQHVMAANGSSAYGAAVLAGIGIGAIRDAQAVTEFHSHSAVDILPEPSVKPVYDRLYRRFLALYEATKDLMHDNTQ